MNFRVAIVGYGSIGKRHGDNISSLGHTIIPIDINEPFDYDVDCAFICTPTQFHAEHAYAYMSKGIPVFIEKPIAHDLESLRSLIKSLKDTHNETLSMVGCNMRFHPAIRDAKELVDKRKTIFARAEFGYYLPFWRKGDYTKTNSASEYGGVILDDLHEIDYLVWLFGKIKDIHIIYGKVSDLLIKKEDIAETSILFENGVSASVHQNYLIKNYHRTLELNFGHQQIICKIYPTNLMYKKEVEYFFNCLKNNETPMNDIYEASYILEKILGAKEKFSLSSVR
ncbi:MAG: Gfo/Idh/MocA family oxidoreductase [Candidatus Paceibacterota bacterium]